MADEHHGTWSTNFAGNIKRWAPDSFKIFGRSAHRLDNRYVRWNTAAIIVGAGPSLANNIGYLRNVHRIGQARPGNRRGALIYATDAALKPLLENDIRPDYVVALDEHVATKRFYEGADTKGMGLLASITAYPEAIKDWQGQVWFWANGNDNVYEDRAFFGFDKASLSLIPWVKAWTNSVSMMAVVLAQRAGIRDHYLIGCDYAVSNGRTHVDGFAVGPDDVFKDQETYHADVMKAMSIHCDRLHRVYRRKHLPVWNCTEGGNLKWNNIPLEQAAQKFGFAK